MTEAFAGAWMLARCILDEDRPTVLTCAGSATLRLAGGAMVYDEAVSFRLADNLMRATRAYRFATADGAIVATFADGSPFFSLRLDAAGIGYAIHDCGDDRYTLWLTLREPAVWRTRWTVTGTKRLSITTDYTRVAASCAKPEACVPKRRCSAATKMLRREEDA